MSEFLLKKVLSELGILCLAYHPGGYFSCVGEAPLWAQHLYSCIRNQFPKILPTDISPFLENFMEDALEFWAQEQQTVLRSGFWTESIVEGRSIDETRSEINLEALAIRIEEQPLMLIESPQFRYRETLHWLQTAREERLDFWVDQKVAASQMMSASLFDSLTGLPNESSFYVQLSQWFEDLREHPTQTFLLIQLEIDRFQDLKLLLSNEGAERILVQVSHRLKACLPSKSVLAHLGVDRFGLLVALDASEPLYAIPERIMAQLRSPYRFASEWVYITTSVGVVWISKENLEVQSAMTQVRLALKQAKVQGRGCISWFDHTLHQQVFSLLSLEQTLLSAIEHEAFYTRFRLMFSRRSDKFVGFELVFEWDHKEYGAFPAQRLHQLVQQSDLVAQLEAYRIDCLQRIIGDRALSSTVSVLLKVPAQLLLDTSYCRRVLALRACLTQDDRLIVNLVGLSANFEWAGFEAVVEQLHQAKIQLGIAMDDVSIVRSNWETPHIIDYVSVDVSIASLSQIQAVISELSSTKLSDPTLVIIAEQVDSPRDLSSLEKTEVDLCLGNCFSSLVDQDAITRVFPALSFKD